MPLKDELPGTPSARDRLSSYDTFFRPSGSRERKKGKGRKKKCILDSANWNDRKWFFFFFDAALLSPGIRLSGITSGKNWRESNEIKWRRSGNKGVEVVYGKIRRRKT